MKFFENKDKVITCPNCGWLLAKADKRDTTMHKRTCNHCKKWIFYVPKSDYKEIHDVPKRTQASGMRFY